MPEDLQHPFDGYLRIIEQAFPQAHLPTHFGWFRDLFQQKPGFSLGRLRYQTQMTERGSGSRLPIQADDLASSDRTWGVLPTFSDGD